MFPFLRLPDLTQTTDRLPAYTAAFVASGVTALVKTHINLVTTGRAFAAAFSLEMEIAEYRVGRYDLERQARVQFIINEIEDKLLIEQKKYLALADSLKLSPAAKEPIPV